MTRARGAVVGALCAALVASVPAADGGGEAVDGGEVPGADHLVHVGADDPGSAPVPSKLDRFEYLDYYPSRLQVHRGDVVRFAWRGDHSVTFYPGNDRVDSLLVRDEVPGQVRLDGIFPSRDDCAVGTAADDLPPCVLSPEAPYLNTGASPPSDDYSARVEVDMPAGTYAYFCIFHSTMRGEIEVVEDEVEIATPAEVAAARTAQIARDTAAAEAVVTSHRTPPPVPVGDHHRWQVQVGGFTDDGRVAVIGYLPANLTIAPGDEVEFVVPAGGIEAHSASFLPLPDPVRAQAPAHYMDIRCDLDGVDDGAPGAPGVPFVLLGQDCPAGDVEVTYHPWAYQQPITAPGNAVVGDAPHDSGILLPPMDTCADTCDPWTGEPLPSSFEAVFPAAGAYEYWCFLHDPRGMVGGITVVAP